MVQIITIVDYHAGNLTSVRLAVEKLGHIAVTTSDPEEVGTAERLIFPGVGAAGAAMDTLRGLGLDEAMADYVATGRPLLGICLGAQVILDFSEEGNVECLGLVAGRVERLQVPAGVKVPHMGWNEVAFEQPHPLWKGLEGGLQYYFVHSYAPAPALKAMAIGTTDYHGLFVSALATDNVAATQFHPERSGRAGLKVLDNFLSWNP
jgi:glutamine amidotransferase